MLQTCLSLSMSGVLMGLVYGLMALGLSVIFGVIRVVNFAHGEIMILAVYLAITLNTMFGFDPILASPIVAVILFGIGYMLQRCLVNRLLTRPEHVQFIVLAAVALILVNAQLMVFGPDAQSILLDYSLDSLEVAGALVDKVKVYSGFVAIITSLGLFAFFKRTYIGKAIRAAADNHLGALVIGLNYKKLYALTFGIGAACVGIAGCLMSLMIDVTPQLAPQLTLLGFVIVIIGGLGSLAGALYAGIFIGLVEEFAGFFFQPSMKSLFSFGILIMVLLFRPQGLLGKRA